MKELNSADISRFKQMVSVATKVVVLSHTSPDGDAIGSSVGLSRMLSGMGISSKVILPDEFPACYRFLLQNDEVMIASASYDQAKAFIDTCDLIIAVDFNDLSRLDILKDVVKESKVPKILIDHHLNPTIDVFDLVFSDNTMSSSAELVYWILMLAYGKTVVTKSVAECLYTGICTDTGSFSYSCNSPTVYNATAHLVEAGVNVSDIHNNIYNSYSKERLLLLGFCINQRLRIFDDMKLAYFYISKEDQKRFAAQKGDLEGVVNYTLMMEDIQVGALVKENDEGVVRISFRSKSDFNVNDFARKYFDGGGHRKASGATSTMNLEDTCMYMEECFRKELLL